MIIHHEATAELKAAGHALILRQMVEALTEAPVDLSNEIAVIIRLSCAGFGSASIIALADDARAAARATAHFARRPRCRPARAGRARH